MPRRLRTAVLTVVAVVAAAALWPAVSDAAPGDPFPLEWPNVPWSGRVTLGYQESDDGPGSHRQEDWLIDVSVATDGTTTIHEATHHIESQVDSDDGAGGTCRSESTTDGANPSDAIVQVTGIPDDPQTYTVVVYWTMTQLTISDDECTGQHDSSQTTDSLNLSSAREPANLATADGDCAAVPAPYCRTTDPNRIQGSYAAVVTDTPHGDVNQAISFDLTNTVHASDDLDHDTVPNASDNCPTVSNQLQLDSDGDGAGNACETDDDNDRIPDLHEVNSYGTSPIRKDTDGDRYADPVEIASGSNPTLRTQTPTSLFRGAAPRTISGSRGDAGITCGQTQFRWVHVTLEPRGAPRGSKACTLLVSNRVAQAMLRAGELRGLSLAAAFEDELVPYMLESIGQAGYDWVREADEDDAVWGGMRLVRRALVRTYNLQRLNGFFTVGNVVGMHGVLLGSVFGLEQLVANHACVQLTLTRGAVQPAGLQINLVYAHDQVTSADLSWAGTWREVERPGPNTTAFVRSNLQCRSGRVVASGGAGQLFASPTSAVFAG